MNRHEKYHKDNRGGKFLCIDSRHLDEHTKSGSVDLVLTSPPYWNQKNYSDSIKQIGFGQSLREYKEALGEVLSKLYVSVKDTGSCWVIVDTIKRKNKTIT